MWTTIIIITEAKAATAWIISSILTLFANVVESKLYCVRWGGSVKWGFYLTMRSLAVVFEFELVRLTWYPKTYCRGIVWLNGLKK